MNKPIPQGRFGKKFKDGHDRIFNKGENMKTKAIVLRPVEISIEDLEPNDIFYRKDDEEKRYVVALSKPLPCPIPYVDDEHFHIRTEGDGKDISQIQRLIMQRDCGYEANNKLSKIEKGRDYPAFQS